MPTIADVAKEAEVSTATVSRVLNNSNKVSEQTREKVDLALEKLDYKLEEVDDQNNNEVTIKDVASEAGVSEATVSRVVNRTARVADQTKQKVKQAIEKLDYSPNANARHLRRNETKLIGLVIPDIWNPFFGGIVKGVEDLARQNDYNVVLFNTSGLFEREKKCVNILKDRRVDGMIYMGKNYDQQRSKLLASCDFPIVVISREEDRIKYPTVNIDNYQAAYDMTKHLIKSGSHKIAFIKGPKKDTTAGLKRAKGYKQALLDNSLEFRSDLLIEGDFTLESGYTGVEKIFDNGLVPDAVFAANDEMAVGAMRKIKAEGYRIPEDIAVAGFDNISLVDYVEPRLTTVAQPIYELGQAGIGALLKLIKGKKLDSNNIVLDYKILARESS